MVLKQGRSATHIGGSSRSNTKCLTQLSILQGNGNLPQQKHMMDVGWEKDLSFLNSPSPTFPPFFPNFSPPWKNYSHKEIIEPAL